MVGKEAENQSFHSSAKTRNFCCEKETLNVTIQYLRSLKNERLDKKKKKKKKKKGGKKKKKKKKKIQGGKNKSIKYYVDYDVIIKKIKNKN